MFWCWKKEYFMGLLSKLFFNNRKLMFIEKLYCGMFISTCIQHYNKSNFLRDKSSLNHKEHIKKRGIHQICATYKIRYYYYSVTIMTNKFKIKVRLANRIWNNIYIYIISKNQLNEIIRMASVAFMKNEVLHLKTWFGKCMKGERNVNQHMTEMKLNVYMMPGRIIMNTFIFIICIGNYVEIKLVTSIKNVSPDIKPFKLFL